MKRVYIFALALVVFVSLPVSATIINIPGDYLIIQQGINASTDGDTVLVQPGTYVENINFNGHNITLGSLFLITGDTTYIAETIIDGNELESVVMFTSGEDTTSVIAGFTLQNGVSLRGGGIYCTNSSPEIRQNKIRWNLAIGHMDMGWGGGICCDGNSFPLITNNIIMENRALGTLAGNALGGGIYCSGSDPLIENNLIIRNTAEGSSNQGGQGQGGGLFCWQSNPSIYNNTISENQAIGYSGGYGGGIYCADSNPIIINTIFWADSNEEIYLDNSTPAIIFCDIQWGWEGEGNIDTDPLFRDPENDDFHLMSTACGDPYDSPCIDAGKPTIIDSLHDCSWGLGTFLSDMGAYGGGDSATVGIDDYSNLIPKRLSLLQNYPNPFNASTIIRYSLPSASYVRIDIYDILGRRAERLIQGEQSAGYHQVTWNADDKSSGIFFYRIQAGEFVETRRMLLLK